MLTPSDAERQAADSAANYLNRALHIVSERFDLQANHWKPTEIAAELGPLLAALIQVQTTEYQSCVLSDRLGGIEAALSSLTDRPKAIYNLTATEIQQQKDNAFIQKVAAAALADFDGVMAFLGLSGGKNQGREYLPLNPLRGDKTPVLVAIDRDLGTWRDFSTDAIGENLVSVAAYLLSCRYIKAAESMAGYLGIAKPDSQNQRQRQGMGAAAVLVDVNARGRHG